MKLVGEDELKLFLGRTTALHEDLAVCLHLLVPLSDEQFGIAFKAGAFAIEHGQSVLMLIKAGCFTSAFALLRPQYETLVRGLCLFHVASDSWISKLSVPLTDESARKANGLVRVDEMVKQLERGDQSPQHIVEQLRDFEMVLFSSLSSYTHGGLHPLSRLASGYTTQLGYDALRNSNAVISFAAQLLVVADGASRMPVLQALLEIHADCFNIIGTSSIKQPYLWPLLVSKTPSRVTALPFAMFNGRCLPGHHKARSWSACGSIIQRYVAPKESWGSQALLAGGKVLATRNFEKTLQRPTRPSQLFASSS